MNENKEKQTGDLPVYDLEICLPLHLEGKYLERAYAFRESGLLNLQGVRAHLTLLTGTHDPEAAGLGAHTWPCETFVCRHTHDHPAAKIHAYYAHILPAYGLKARWYLRVDDDSLTDVGGMMRHINATLQHTDPLHLIGHPFFDTTEPYQAILRELGQDEFLPPENHPSAGIIAGDHSLIPHEWEVSLSSHAAMKRILAHPPSRDLLRHAAHETTMPSDRCFAFAARLAGIPASVVPFLTHEPRLESFAPLTPTRRGFFHVHYVAPDYAASWRLYLEMCCARDVAALNTQGFEGS